MEKSILVDFDQFITPVNKWKAKWLHEGYSWFKKNTKTTPVSAVLPPSDLLFFIERTIARIHEGPFNEGFNYSMAQLRVGPLGDL